MVDVIKLELLLIYKVSNVINFVSLEYLKSDNHSYIRIIVSLVNFISLEKFKTDF